MLHFKLVALVFKRIPICISGITFLPQFTRKVKSFQPSDKIHWRSSQRIDLRLHLLLTNGVFSARGGGGG